MTSEKARFAAFLLTGAIAASVNIVTRWLLQHIMSFEAAIAGAFLAGLTTAFLLARIFVFNAPPGAPQGAPHWQFMRFTVVNLVALVQVFVVSVGLARYVFPWFGLPWLGDTAAHVIGVLSPVASSYILHKHFSFRSGATASTSDHLLTANHISGHD